MEKTASGITRKGKCRSSYKRKTKRVKPSSVKIVRSYSKEERDAELIRKYGMVIE